MKAWIYLASLLSLSTRSFAAEALTLSYSELEKILAKNNRSVQSLQATTEAARQRIGTLGQTFLPKVGLEAGMAEQREANGARDRSPFWRIDVQANLYRGGRDKIATLVRESQVLIKDLDTQAQLRSELFKAKTDYIHLLHVRQAIGLVQSSMDDYEGLRKSILRKAQAGLMTSTAADTLQLEVDKLERDLIQLKGEESELEDRLALILGVELDQKIVLTSKPESLPNHRALKLSRESLGSLPEIKRLSLLGQATEMESKLQRGWWVPEIAGFVSYTDFRIEEGSEVRSLPEREWALGLRFSVDLESKRSLNSELAAKNSEILSYKSQRDYLAREVEHKMHEYRREIEIQSQLIGSYDEGLNKAAKILQKLRAEFEKGLGSNAELAEAISTLYELKRQRIESFNKYYLAAAGLETMANLSG